MKFYDEEKLLKLRNVLIIVVLALWALLLFFKVYDNFAKSIRMVTSTIFPFILSFVIVYCLMPFIDIISIFYNFSLYSFDDCANNYKTNIKSYRLFIKKSGKTAKQLFWFS